MNELIFTISIVELIGCQTIDSFTPNLLYPTLASPNFFPIPLYGTVIDVDVFWLIIKFLFSPFVVICISYIFNLLVGLLIVTPELNTQFGEPKSYKLTI